MFTLPFINKLLPALGALQIVHDIGDHWNVASDLSKHKIDGQPMMNDCQVLGYDSLYDEAAQEKLEAKLTLMTCQRQERVKDCGVFAGCASLYIEFDTSWFSSECHESSLDKVLSRSSFNPFP